VKIGPVDTEIALLIVKKIKNKKLTQAKYVAQSATEPSGLNKINAPRTCKSLQKFLQTFANFCKFAKVFKPANLPKGLYILPSVIFIFFFLLRAKLPQYLLDRFSRSFHLIEVICVNFLDQVQFFRFIKGHCHGNQFSGKMGQNYHPLHLLLCHSETVWDNATYVQD